VRAVPVFLMLLGYPFEKCMVEASGLRPDGKAPRWNFLTLNPSESH